MPQAKEIANVRACGEEELPASQVPGEVSVLEAGAQGRDRGMGLKLQRSPEPDLQGCDRGLNF